MKYFLLTILLTSTLHAAETYPGGDPDKNAAMEDAPGTSTPEEQEEKRERAKSMGGAPNMGVGAGTGTGAGSTVGNEVDDNDEVQDAE